MKKLLNCWRNYTRKNVLLNTAKNSYLLKMYSGITRGYFHKWLNNKVNTM